VPKFGPSAQFAPCTGAVVNGLNAVNCDALVDAVSTLWSMRVCVTVPPFANTVAPQPHSWN
jgi:hypothetical protein